MKGVAAAIRSSGLRPLEVTMPRTLSLIAVCALALAVCAPGRSQDSPSLGDLARQAQKDKDKSSRPAAKVLTNDDVSSGSSGAPSALGGGLGPAAPSTGAAGSPGATPTPAESLNRLESLLTQVDSLDRATLAHNVLQDKDVNFPGRAKWEERLFAAKQSYVTQGRAMLQKARQIEASAESLKGSQDPNDPRVKELSAKLQDLVRDGVQVGAAFQAVMMEGRDLASQDAAH
jgi:hypothetical protein